MNVLDGKSQSAQMPANQNGPVTRQRILFGAKQGDVVFANPVADAQQSVRKRGGLRHQIVAGLSIHITFRLVTSRTQFTAKKNILEAVFQKPALQQVLVELRQTRAVRLRPDICHHFHPMPAEQSNERCQLVIGMADGEKRVHLVSSGGSMNAAANL